MTVDTNPKPTLPEGAENPDLTKECSEATDESCKKQSNLNEQINNSAEKFPDSVQKLTEKHKGFENIPGGEFLSLPVKELQQTFLTKNPDGSFTVNFHGNNGAYQAIGICHLFDFSDLKEKDAIVGNRRGSLSEGHKPGFYDTAGYIPIDSGDTIKFEKSAEKTNITEKSWGASLSDFKDYYQKNSPESLKANAGPSTTEIELFNDSEFAEKFARICKSLGVEEAHLKEIIRHESKFDCRAVNRIGAVGLIQWIPKTARSLGTSPSELLQMTPVQQLDYVEKYLKPYAGRLNRPVDLALAILYPARIGEGPNSVLGGRFGEQSSALIARQNPLTSQVKRTGRVTVADVSQFYNMPMA